MNQDNGNILMKLIYLCMDHLMHNPKRAIIILFVIFIVTMITGELIGTMRNSEMVFSPTAIPIVSGKTEDFFILPEINDRGAVDLTPHPEITETSTPEMPIVKTHTPTPTEAQPVSCTSDLGIAAGKMAVIDFPGGYSAEINVRYRPAESVPKMCGKTFSPASIAASSALEYSNGRRLLKDASTGLPGAIPSMVSYW